MEGCQQIGWMNRLTQVDQLSGVLLGVDGERAEGEVVNAAPLLHHHHQLPRTSHHLFFRTSKVVSVII